MSTSCGFFNSFNKDRVYNATHFGHCFDGIINDGILASIGDCFVVKAAGGMSVTIGSGKAWYRSSYLENDTEIVKNLNDCDLVLDRIDAVVMEFDSTEAVRWNDFKVVEGTASSNPVNPILENTLSKVQVPLAYITIPANATEITQSNIKSVIGTDECPFVTGILETVSLDTLLGQWEDDLNQFEAAQEALFAAWFANIKTQLNGDVAGNLQNQIEDLQQHAIDTQQLSPTITLSAASWTGNEVPYTQTVSVKGIRANDRPHWSVVYSGELDEKLAQKEAFEVIDDLETADDTLTFVCFEEKPTIDLEIQIEVNR